jgi:hypothetical protein
MKWLCLARIVMRKDEKEIKNKKGIQSQADRFHVSHQSICLQQDNGVIGKI